MLRSLGPPAALALILAQLVAGHPGVFAGAIAAALLGHGHGHELSLLGDAGHVDVVLHHEDHGDATGAAGPRLDAHAGDHVLHLTASDTMREGKPRVATPVIALPVPVQIAPPKVSALALRDLPMAEGGSAALLRSVVLRI
jgi:hypothetical protein